MLSYQGWMRDLHYSGRQIQPRCSSGRIYNGDDCRYPNSLRNFGFQYRRYDQGD